MRLELTEVLACPRCGPDHGLIAFVDQMDGRRITAGRFDCPNCEDRHQVKDGVVFLSGSQPVDVRDDGDAGLSACVPADTGVLDLMAALLGPPTGPEILFVGPGLGLTANSLADLRPLASILAYGYPPGEWSERVHWIVPVHGSPLPMRSARLHGAVVAGTESVDSTEAGRILVPGCRLVILPPVPEAPSFMPGSPVRKLASDSRAWVGVRE